VVTTTPRDLIIAGYARSIRNRPKTIATEETELLNLVIRLFRGWYAYAATVNYTVFAGLVDVEDQAESGGPDLDGWERPEDAEVIFRIERTRHTTGGSGSARDEVSVVPYDDPKAEPGKGAVYRIGQVFLPAGNAKDPTGGTLRFFFSRRPTDPSSLDDTVDAAWIESYNDLLILDIAMYLAAKDGRADEVAQLTAERTEWTQRFTNFLMHPEAKELHRFATTRRTPGTPLTPTQAG
jgi:hypothetical protein